MLLITLTIGLLSPFTVFAVTSGSLPKITIFKHSFADILGDPNKNKNLELECHAEGNPKPKIEFQINNVALKQSDRVLRLSQNRLKILNVSYETDEGDFKCVAVNENGRVFKKKYIEIESMGYFLPGNRIDDKLKVRHVTLGRPLILPCPRHTKTHPVKYYWGNAGQPPKHIQENKRINVLDNGLLHISSLRQEDIEDFNQKYHGISCLMASNGHTTPSVKIAFKADEVFTGDIAPSVFQHLAKDTFVRKGDDQSLRCFASGNPTPGITWFRNGEQIESNDSRFEVNPFRPGELTIRNFDKSLEGQYKCLLSNREGKAETSTNVKLAEPPKISVKMEPQTIQRNRRLMIDCRAAGTQPLTYQWYRNGKLLTSYSTNNATMEITDNLLTIDAINYNHGGKYQCFVYNLYGETSNVSEVTIIEPSINRGHSIDGSEPLPTSPAFQPSTNVSLEESSFVLEMKYIIIIACGGVVALLIFVGGLILYCRKRKDNKDVHFIPTRRPDLHPVTPPRPSYSEPLDVLPPPPSSLTNYTDDEDVDKFSCNSSLIGRKAYELTDLMHDIRTKHLQQQSSLLESKQENLYYDIPEFFYENQSNAPSTEL